jgi:GT2 family glycosyltransferase
MPVWNTNEKWLREAIDSVIAQAYDNWELCLADDNSTEKHVKTLLESYTKKDKRVKALFLKDNLGVSGASNAAIDMAEGDFFGFMDHDDFLVPSALYEVANLLNRKPKTDFIYSDEFLTDETGKPVYAYYKPDFSLDYFLSHCYLVHFSVIRSEIIRKIGGFRREFNISQDYDLFLRTLSETRNVQHIPKALYLWRQHSLSAGHKMQSQVMAKSRKAIQDFLDREGIEGEACDTKYFNFFRVKRKIAGNPRVSIIIPTKDKADLLRRCIESIEGTTDYKNYEVLVVDNLSREAETLKYLNALQSRRETFRVVEFKENFNYSRINNFAAKYAAGEHYLFLNNDVEVISPEWISAMLEQSQRKESGCVGAKLLYPDGKVQHVGVIIGWGGRAEHIYKWYDSRDIGYLGHFVSIRNYSAVTAACMMVKKTVFEEAGGFDEKFKVGFGDVDLCLRIQKRGYVNVYTPYAELYHHESATRNPTLEGDSHPQDTELFVTRWREIIENGDPFYNPNLPLDSYDILPYINFR